MIYSHYPTSPLAQPDRLSAAYKLAGVKEPSRVLEIQRLVAEAPTVAQITNRLAREALTADDASMFFEDALNQIRDAQAADAFRHSFTAQLEQYVQRTISDTLTAAVADLTPAFTRMADGFSVAARKLPALAPLDVEQNVEADTTKEYKIAKASLGALSIYASIFVSSTPGDLPADLNQLLPVVSMPEVQVELIDRLYRQPVPGQDTAGSYSVRAFARAAMEDLDLAVIGVARGDYEGLTLSLATPAELRERRARAVAAHTTKAVEGGQGVRVMR